MWLSEKLGSTNEPSAGIGEVTIAGETAAVYTDAEHRSLSVFSPGGYIWRPKVGDNVLVIKCGGNEMCVAGLDQSNGPAGMEAGEVYIKSNAGASIYLKNDGRIVLGGKVYIDGSLYLNGNALG